ncbi:hypothetical protein Tco_1403494 [Tanacetum coccineum]
MAFVPKHNQVGFLKKPEGSAGFEQIVDFLKGTHIRYALEHNPTIYVSVIKQFWQTVTVITLDNGEQELKATIDTHEYTISESSVRNKLKLADENGITEFTNAEIFEGMANLGYPIDNTFTEGYIPERLEAAETLAKFLTQRPRPTHRKVKTGFEEEMDVMKLVLGEGIRYWFHRVDSFTWNERVDEHLPEEFQMGSIPQGSAPAKIVKWQILKTGKKGAYSNPLCERSHRFELVTSPDHVKAMIPPKDLLAPRGKRLLKKASSKSRLIADDLIKIICSEMIRNVAEENSACVSENVGS